MKVVRRFLYWLFERQTLRNKVAELEKIIEQKNKHIIAAASLVEKERALRVADELSRRIEKELVGVQE